MVQQKLLFTEELQKKGKKQTPVSDGVLTAALLLLFGGFFSSPVISLS